MCMRKPLSVKYLLLVCLSVVGLACTNGNDRPKSEFDRLIGNLREGDLLFRKGTGIAGRIVTSLDSSGEYSHVGIVVRIDGRWHVVHAVPHEPDFEGDIDRVKCEPIELFTSRYPQANYGHYRTTATNKQRKIAIHHALRLSAERRPFDHDYNLEDTSKLYCTELVEYVYSLAGVSISQGRRTHITFPSLSGDHILPSDLTEGGNLKPIY